MLMRARLWQKLPRAGPIHCATLSRSYSNINLERLENRSLLRVQGSDAASFLQGLITNDMNHFQNGASSIYAMLLNTAGRVLFDTMIYRMSPEQSDRFLVECDVGLAEALRKHLTMFRIRKKVEITPAESSVWVAFTDQKGSLPERIHGAGVSSFKDTRLAELGYRIITDNTVSLDAVKAAFPNGTSFAEKASYLEHRLSLGIGEGVKSFPQGKCFPLESNCDYMHGVSFHKGCYIGQELTARTHHTGVVRKRLMPLSFEKPVPDNELPEDAEIKSLEGQVVGKLRGVRNLVGIGLLRIEKVLPTQTLVLAEKYNCSTKRPFWWPKEQPKMMQSCNCDTAWSHATFSLIDISFHLSFQNMSAEEKTNQLNTNILFTCELCKWTETCSYYGKQAPFVRNLKFVEDCYVMRDPFCPPPSVKQSSSVEYFIVIGAECRICSKAVCKNAECSFFYANTYCRKCALSGVAKFPLEIQSRIKKQFRN